MAGQIPLDTRYYPSDFNYESIVVPATTGGYDLIYADRPMVIDSIRMTIPNLPTNAAADTDIKFRKYNPVKGVTPPSFATVPSGGMVVSDVTEPLTVKLGQSPGTGTSNDYPDVLNFPILTTGNVLEPGQTLRYTGISLTSVIHVTFQIRWRSQL